MEIPATSGLQTPQKLKKLWEQYMPSQGTGEAKQLPSYNQVGLFNEQLTNAASQT